MAGINKVFEANSFSPAYDAIGGGTVTVEQDAFIQATGDNGIEFSAGSFKVKVDGYVASDKNGMSFYDPTVPIKNSTMAVGAEATILGGTGFSGINTGMALDVVNSGLIRGDTNGIWYHSIAHSLSKTVSITNSADGLIHGDHVGIFFDDAAHALTVKNKGSISGDIITGTAITWRGAATIVNDYYLGGDVTALDVNSTLGISFTNNKSAYGLYGNLSLANGDDVVKNLGYIRDDVHLFGGNNQVTNSGSMGDLTAGSGNDSLINKGGVGSVDLGSGKNLLSNSGNIGAVTMAGGDDTMTNTSGVFGDVVLGNGVNKLTNSGLITGVISFGTGNDTLVNSGEIRIALSVSSGDNKVTNSGTMVDLTCGDANDVVSNTGFMEVVSLGNGNNSFTNSGSAFSVTGGTGADVVKNTGSIVDVNLGAGSDTFIGGSANEDVTDDLGDDTYTLGAGKDELTLIAGKDSCDGGAGNDFLYLDSLNGATFVNLDSKAIVLGGSTLAATSAVSSGVNAALKNFECVVGSAQVDKINGSAGANNLYGNDDNDFLSGGLGADYLDGGSGDDTFVYFSTKDSGVTAATRDRIVTFEGANTGGGDVINLKAIDADIKAVDDQAFSFIGNSQEFTHVAGQLRTVPSGDGDILVQGDVNGDAKADFSILMVGVQALSGLDFTL
jgi:hypothetical protein